jgi:hypothetical protein
MPAVSIVFAQFSPEISQNKTMYRFNYNDLCNSVLQIIFGIWRYILYIPFISLFFLILTIPILAHFVIG